MVRVVDGDGVRRLPRREHEREVEDLPVDRGVGLEILTPQHPLVGHERGHRPHLEVRRQLGPGMARRGHFRQRPDRVLAGAFDEHAGGPFTRPVQRQAVLGEGSSRPELATRLEGKPAGVAKAQQAGPILGAHGLCHRPEQTVEVAAHHEPLEPFLVHVGGYTSGQG